MLLRFELSVSQLRGIKDHKYSAQGISICDQLFQKFWTSLVNYVPLWVAPNLITFVGLIVNLATTLPIIISDPNCLGEAPRWMYFMCAVGVFVYQTLDAIDGKQARRTKTNNPLGELFDHGCDAISTFIVVLAGASAAGLNEYPNYCLSFVLIIELLNYCYHWQTYVSGTLYFKKVDVTEGQMTHILVMIATSMFGPQLWQIKFPVIGVPIKFLLICGVFGFSFVNFFSTFFVILTMGKGKHGSTVADTSVLSPVIPVGFIAGMMIYYAMFSPSKILETHSMLLMGAMAGPIVKMVLLMMVSGMACSPLPLLDPILLWPLIAVINVTLNGILPEYYVLLFVVLIVSYDIISSCVVVVKQVCRYLEVSCFTIPHPSSSSSSSSTSQQQRQHMNISQ